MISWLRFVKNLIIGVTLTLVIIFLIGLLAQLYDSIIKPWLKSRRKRADSEILDVWEDNSSARRLLIERSEEEEEEKFGLQSKLRQHMSKLSLEKATTTTEPLGHHDRKGSAQIINRATEFPRAEEVRRARTYSENIGVKNSARSAVPSSSTMQQPQEPSPNPPSLLMRQNSNQSSVSTKKILSDLQKSMSANSNDTFQITSQHSTGSIYSSTDHPSQNNNNNNSNNNNKPMTHQRGGNNNTPIMDNFTNTSHSDPMLHGDDQQSQDHDTVHSSRATTPAGRISHSPTSYGDTGLFQEDFSSSTRRDGYITPPNYELEQNISANTQDDDNNDVAGPSCFCRHCCTKHSIRVFLSIFGLLAALFIFTVVTCESNLESTICDPFVELREQLLEEAKSHVVKMNKTSNLLMKEGNSMLHSFMEETGKTMLREPILVLTTIFFMSLFFMIFCFSCFCSSGQKKQQQQQQQQSNVPSSSSRSSSNHSQVLEREERRNRLGGQQMNHGGGGGGSFYPNGQHHSANIHSGDGGYRRLSNNSHITVGNRSLEFFGNQLDLHHVEHMRGDPKGIPLPNLQLIQQTIRLSSVFCLFIHHEDSFERDLCVEELHYAMEIGKPIIIVTSVHESLHLRSDYPKDFRILLEECLTLFPRYTIHLTKNAEDTITNIKRYTEGNRTPGMIWDLYVSHYQNSWKKNSETIQIQGLTRLIGGSPIIELLSELISKMKDRLSLEALVPLLKAQRVNGNIDKAELNTLLMIIKSKMDDEENLARTSSSSKNHHHHHHHGNTGNNKEINHVQIDRSSVTDRQSIGSLVEVPISPLMEEFYGAMDLGGGPDQHELYRNASAETARRMNLVELRSSKSDD